MTVWINSPFVDSWSVIIVCAVVLAWVWARARKAVCAWSGVHAWVKEGSHSMALSVSGWTKWSVTVCWMDAIEGMVTPKSTHCMVKFLPHSPP
jgi:hypothetical protein